MSLIILGRGGGYAGLVLGRMLLVLLIRFQSRTHILLRSLKHDSVLLLASPATGSELRDYFGYDKLLSLFSILPSPRSSDSHLTAFEWLGGFLGAFFLSDQGGSHSCHSSIRFHHKPPLLLSHTEANKNFLHKKYYAHYLNSEQKLPTTKNKNIPLLFPPMS
jgi:hypothetical protein